MNHLNIEIKARSNNQDAIRKILQKQGADFKGIDHQVDTYFRVPHGRLKLREGNIENYLIHYQREETQGLKSSIIKLFTLPANSNLKEILSDALGIFAVVDKKREIYFIENVKFHIDTVENLGDFIEIEALDKNGTIGKEKLTKQCNFYIKLLDVQKNDLVAASYSDLILER